MDDHLEEMLKEAMAGGDTAIILTSDHGIGLGEVHATVAGYGSPSSNSLLPIS